ncbi:MAG: BON domain-containing protein [Acidimicrobiia bacterium]
MPEPADQPKQYVVAKVNEVLAHDPRVGELDVQVKVVGQQVFLTGSVSTAPRHELIGRVVEELLPDHQVHNEVVVTTADGDPETEELA